MNPTAIFALKGDKQRT